jgi:hypothetical protein
MEESDIRLLTTLARFHLVRGLPYEQSVKAIEEAVPRFVGNKLFLCLYPFIWCIARDTPMV